MKERYAHFDGSTNPPMIYLVSGSCPKLLEGHSFYACQCRGPAVLERHKPSILVSCEYFLGEVVDGVKCNYGGEKTPGSGVQFGVPTVLHSEDLSDGGNKD